MTCPPGGPSFVSEENDNPLRPKESHMRYALLIYSAPGSMDHLSEDELAEVSKEFWALRDDPAFIDGAQLQPVTTATTVRERDGRTLITDGPFADTKEVFGGYYVVDVPDLDAATALAERIPITRFGGAVEIRPAVGAPVAAKWQA